MLQEVFIDKKNSYMSFAGMKEKPDIEFNEIATADKIISLVCQFYGVELKSVTGKRRDKQLCLCRHVSVYLIRRNTSMVYREIGQKLGGRDHSTSINSMKKIGWWLETDTRLSEEVDHIQSLI